MSENKSILTEIIERRIPQILGVYVASVWLAVEIADWMSERFDVPTQFSSYVFVIMIAFVPLVALLAWGHGRPGRDKWTQKQLLFIPINMVLAWFAVTTLIKPVAPEAALSPAAATEIIELTDVQTGELVEYEIAKSGMSQNVTGFFWDNKTGDDSLDWLSYGSMWLVAKDLMRNPIISIRTPYDSTTMMRSIVSKGFERAVGTPLSLNLDVSADRDAQWMINGEITKDEGKITFKANLYDVLTGALVTTTTSSYDDLLFALDDVAEQLAAVILEEAKIPTNIIPQMPLSEYISGNLDAIQSVINSLNAKSIDNDFTTGIAQLKSAVESDEQLAEAYVLMMDYYRAMGDVESAKLAANEALKLEYKLSPRDGLKVKANYYAIDGETDKAIRVLENWVKLEPESADALQALGTNYIVIGNHLDEALEVYTKLSEIQKSNATALVNQARIYRLKGNQEMALKALKLYAQNDPEKESPWLEMGETYLQFGDLEKAQESYEEASLLSFNKISADLALAKLTAFKGDVESGLEEIDKLVEKSVTDSAKFQVLTEKEVLLYSTGRVEEALGVVLASKEISATFMPPFQQQITYGAKEATYLAYLQDYEGAWERLKQAKEIIKPPYDGFLGVVEVTIHELTGDNEKAIEKLAEFEQFTVNLDLSVYDQFILSSKAIQARVAGEYDKAIQLHDQALTESSQSFLTLNTLSVVDDLLYKKSLTLFEMGKYSEVIESLSIVLKRNPMMGQAKLLVAEAHVELAQFDQAQRLLDDVKALWANANSNFKHLKDLAMVEAKLAAAEN